VSSSSVLERQHGLGDPWCAIWANAKLEQSGIRGTRSPSSQSFRGDPNFAELDGPALGAIAVYWRGSPDSGLGHVGFYIGETATQILTLGANESDAVRSQFEPRAKLLGYWWPESVPLPDGGVIEVTSEAGNPEGKVPNLSFPVRGFWRGRLALPTRWSVLRRDTLTPRLGGFCEGLLGGKSARSGVRVQMSHRAVSGRWCDPNLIIRVVVSTKVAALNCARRRGPTNPVFISLYIAPFAIIRAKSRRRNG